MAARNNQVFSLATIERIRRHKGLCTIYNLTEEERKALISKLKDAVVISAIKYPRKYTLYTAFGKFADAQQEKSAAKVLKFIDMVEKENKVVAIDTAEMLEKGAYAFLGELNETHKLPVVFISSHPRYQYLLHDMPFYKNKVISEVDWKIKY